MREILKKIISIWGYFLAIASGIWLYFETSDFFKENQLYFIVGSLILSVIAYYAFEYFERKFKSKSFKYSINESLKNIKVTIEGMDAKTKKYELLLFLWRIKIEEKKLENIYSGNWSLKALETYEYSRYVFGSILKLLSEEDTYNTLSNLDFWAADRFGDTDFIAMNLDASKRGVTINRVIILDGNILENPKSFNKEITKIREIVNEIKLRMEDVKNLNNFFYISKNYLEESLPPVPFALISDKKSINYMTISPSNLSDKNPEIKIDIKKSKHEIHYDINKNRFDEIFFGRRNKLLSVDAMKALIDNTK
ncbi:hypothetical protein [Aquimarina macrocephali]|uniref:hypothetical protein n=1 Tax=Aquimarina macrocephali TaxID=666563 RepID=UPI0004655003|nr:hypothetical protein [Aquimarina macrocephali]